MVDASYHLRDAILSRDADRAANLAWNFDQPINTYYFRKIAPKSKTLSQLDMVPNFPAIKQLNTIIALDPFNTIQSIVQLLEVGEAPLRKRLALILDNYLYNGFSYPLVTVIQAALSLPEVEDIIMGVVRGNPPTATELDAAYKAIGTLRNGKFLIAVYNPTWGISYGSFVHRTVNLVFNSRLMATWFATLYGGGQSLAGSTSNLSGYTSQESITKALLLAPDNPQLFNHLYTSMILSYADLRVMVLESLLGHNPLMLTNLVLPRTALLALINAFVRKVSLGRDDVSKIDLLTVSQDWRPYLEQLDLPLTNLNNTWEQLSTFSSLPGVRGRLIDRFKAYVADDLGIDPEFSLQWLVDEIPRNQRYQHYFSHRVPRDRLEQLLAMIGVN